MFDFKARASRETNAEIWNEKLQDFQYKFQTCLNNYQLAKDANNEEKADSILNQLNILKNQLQSTLTVYLSYQSGLIGPHEEQQTKNQVNTLINQSDTQKREIDKKFKSLLEEQKRKEEEEQQQKQRLLEQQQREQQQQNDYAETLKKNLGKFDENDDLISELQEALNKQKAKKTKTDDSVPPTVSESPSSKKIDEEEQKVPNNTAYTNKEFELLEKAKKRFHDNPSLINRENFLKAKRAVENKIREIENENAYNQFKENQKAPSEIQIPELSEYREEDIQNARNTWQGQPKFMGQATKHILERALKEAHSKYQPYFKERVAELSDAQQIAKEKAYESIERPEFQKLFNIAKDKLGELSDKKSVDDIKQYMNPYEENVLDSLQKRMQRNLQETMPLIDSNFIAKGAYRSSGRQAARQKALRNMQEAFAHEAGNLMNQGYQNAADLSFKDLERQKTAAAEMENLKAVEQDSNLKNIDLIDKIGTREQQLEQTKKNLQYEDFIKALNYGPEKTARLNEIVKGLPVNYRTTTTDPYTPQASPWTQLGGMAGSMYAMNQMNQKNHKHGGRVKKAAGGSLEQQTPNPGLDYQNKLNMALQQLHGSNVNPMWSALANMGAHIASNRKPGVISAIGESMPSGLEGYRHAMDQNNARDQQAVNLMKMIEESRRFEEEQALNRELKQENIALLKAQRQQLGAKNLGKMDPITQNLYQDTLKDLNAKSEAAESLVPKLESLKKHSQIVGKTDVLNTFELPNIAVAAGDTVRSLLGNKEKKLPAYEQMQSELGDIYSYLVSQTKDSRFSDKDAEALLKRLPALKFSPEGREEIIKDMQQYFKRQQEKNTFFTQAAEQHIPISEARKVWSQYSSKNPLFVQQETKYPISAKSLDEVSDAELETIANMGN